MTKGSLIDGVRLDNEEGKSDLGCRPANCVKRSHSYATECGVFDPPCGLGDLPGGCVQAFDEARIVDGLGRFAQLVETFGHVLEVVGCLGHLAGFLEPGQDVAGLKLRERCIWRNCRSWWRVRMVIPSNIGAR